MLRIGKVVELVYSYNYPALAVFLGEEHSPTACLYAVQNPNYFPLLLGEMYVLLPETYSIPHVFIEGTYYHKIRVLRKADLTDVIKFNRGELIYGV